MRTPIPFIRAMIALTISAHFACAAETTPAAYLDAALDIMELNSINREKINWQVFRQQAHERITGAKTIQDVHTQLRVTIKELGDGHSFMRPPPTAPTGTSVDRAQWKPRAARGEMMGDIAYVFMPTVPGGTPQANTAFADGLQKILADLDVHNPIGWVLDLRENAGGSMWPMMAGIGPLLGEGENGRFLTHGQTNTWWYRAGVSGLDRKSNTKISTAPYQLKRPLPPVAVLTGPKTASSGEAIVVAFRGRPSTRFFGAATYGQSTSNQGYRLSDGTMIFLTIGIYVDRTGKAYGMPIEPDVTILTPADANGDPVLNAAIDWLRGPG
jgi:carboxyl-terminal processing protease